MEKSVYSMLAEQVVFSGTQEQCEEYVKNNSFDANQLYIVEYAEN